MKLVAKLSFWKIRLFQNRLHPVVCCMALAALLGCTSEAMGGEGSDQETEPGAYVLVLTDTSKTIPPWLEELRKEETGGRTLVVSGYPGERVAELMTRIPWLLQPGVDSLIIGPDYEGGKRICDSLIKWSPHTVCYSMSP